MISAINTTVIWHRVQKSEEVHYEKASSEVFHLLNLNYSVTGLLEISVTFSSAVCEKSSTIEYLGKILQ